MKKKTKKIIIASAVVIIAAAAVLTYASVSANAEQSAKFSTEYSVDAVTKGDISLTVSGSGNLASAKTLSVEADSHLDISKVLVYEGDILKEGQAIASLNITKMQAYADDLKDQIDSAQTQIDTANSVNTRLSIKSPADGWVKSVVLDDDESIEDAMSEYGYVALVATEKREIIRVQGNGLLEGDTVRVKCQNRWHDGTVIKENGALCVSIATIARKVGAEAQVYDKEGNLLFTGNIELAAYKPVESTYGIITGVKFSENESIEAGEVIYSAEQYSQDVKALYDNIAELKSELEVIEALIEEGEITTPAAGVVNTLSMAAGQSADEGSSLITIDSADNWIATVSIDELDINRIIEGQSVDVTLDSLPNETFDGVVSRISSKGAASGGITTYNVDVSVPGSDMFKLGMSVSCEITAQEAKDAVLIPVDDVLGTNSKSYVMVAVQRTEDEKSAIKQLIFENNFTALKQYMGDDTSKLGITMLSDPSQLLYGQVRAVETGIEDAYYIEIKSGLSEGDKVISQSTDEDSSDNRFMIGGFGNMTGEMRDMQGGGNMPGGRNMPGGNPPNRN